MSAACATCLVVGYSIPAVAQAPATQAHGDPAAEQSDADAADGETPAELDDILKLDIEQLGKVDIVVPSMDIEVTSVTRTESTVGRSAAAVFVITPEMIRRSGATTIPDVLRMAPGVEVARISSSKYAITIRGFNSYFSNKLLVQIDGRSIYSPLYGGVQWDTHSVMLQDVERIEVIRGPGATVWGSNAVNGIINIITKSSKDTQGPLVFSGAGTEQRAVANTRYGGRIGNNGYYRVYQTYMDWDHGFLANARAVDDWHRTQTGFRADFNPNACDTFTIQGDWYNSVCGDETTLYSVTPPYSGELTGDVGLDGGNILARYSRDQGEKRGWAIQSYFSRDNRNTLILPDKLDMIDVDFQHQFPVGQQNALIWGCGYRFNKSRTGTVGATRCDPQERDLNLSSCFVQDEITLREDELFFTVGSKFEHNTYTGFEYQPTGRLLWAPDPRRAVWGAISRAVRIPSRLSEELRQIRPIVPPVLFAQLRGNSALEAEDMMAYEMGYRAQPTDAFSWDVAAFFNKYENVIAVNPGPNPFPFSSTWVFPFDNAASAETYGFELTSTLQVNPWWRVTGCYSFLQIQVHPYPGVTPSYSDANEGFSPHNRLYVRSSWDLARDVELDVMVRYVDRLADVDKYIAMDARLAWQVTANLGMALVAQNLCDPGHIEFIDSSYDYAYSTGTPAGFYGVVTWNY
ncbi:MAG: hypothetical protein A2V70_03550 [Planctomycetes bacterium RBG_13_63_9]|nr:MAG: hypothetical protein A2V70_03550 [Planctomycetes bacterium RBG_13_63_9]